MSDDSKKQHEPLLEPLRPSASGLSSGSLHSDPSLERLLGAIAKGLDGLVLGNGAIAKGMGDLAQGNAELRRAFGDLQKFIMQSGRRSETRITDLQTAVSTFVDRVEAVVTAQKLVVGTTVDARKALDASRRSVDKMVKDITGQHDLEAIMAADRAAQIEAAHASPKIIREYLVKAADFAWPHAMRTGRDAVLWGAKLVAGTTSIAGITKIIHDLWTYWSAGPTW